MKPKILGVLNGKTEDELIEVMLNADAHGRERVQLRYVQWGSGVGWYTQKTLDVDASQVERLVQALLKVRRSEAPSSSGDGALRSVVVPFAKRQAAG